MCQQPESYSALPGPEKLEVLLALLRQIQTGLLLIKDTGTRYKATAVEESIWRTVRLHPFIFK